MYDEIRVEMLEIITKNEFVAYEAGKHQTLPQILVRGGVETLDMSGRYLLFPQLIGQPTVQNIDEVYLSKMLAGGWPMIDGPDEREPWSIYIMELRNDGVSLQKGHNEGEQLLVPYEEICTVLETFKNWKPGTKI